MQRSIANCKHSNDNPASKTATTVNDISQATGLNEDTIIQKIAAALARRNDFVGVASAIVE